MIFLIIAIIVFVYWFIGMAFTNACIDSGYHGRRDFVALAIIAFAWPYLMLIRFFKYRNFIMKQKAIEAYEKANKDVDR